MKLAIAVACLLATPALAAADCAMLGLVPKVLNDGSTITADGGFVVAAVSEDRGPIAKGDVAADTGWLLGKKQKPAVIKLAPGLAVYQTGGVATELLDGTKPVARLAGVAKRDRLEAPKVTTILYEHRRGRRMVSRVIVQLETVPPGAVALVLADDKGKPRSFGLVKGTTVDAFLSRDCLVLPNGTVPSETGDSVKLAFVDDAGRLSASTAAIKIVAKP